MTKNYNLRARLFPTIITAIPFVILANCLMNQYLKEQLSQIDTWLQGTIHVGLSAAIIYFLSQINRIVSKEVFQRMYFKDEQHMPSTDYMLHADGFFEPVIKDKIRDKISTRYSIDLLTIDAERSDTGRARRMIATACSQIRNDLRSNSLLLQHNIEYGFIRNLIGGCLLAFLASFVLLLYSGAAANSLITGAAVFLGLFYLTVMLSGKWLIHRTGSYYAKVLYEQFLSL